MTRFYTKNGKVRPIMSRRHLTRVSDHGHFDFEDEDEWLDTFNWIDDMSNIMDTEIEKKLLQLRHMNEGVKKLYEKQGQKVLGPEEDSPFFEGHSGLRSFMGQGIKNQIHEILENKDLEFLEEMMEPWFSDSQDNSEAKWNKMSADTRNLVWALSKREFSEPITIYRQFDEDQAPNFVKGETIKFDRPLSFSSQPQALMGDITFVVKDIRHGTHVSALSRYHGEGEIVSYAPNGYIVDEIEQRHFGDRPTRKIVTVHEI